MKPRPTALPRARETQLVIEAMAEETLVYDLRRHKAHYLNPTAALIWRCCRDGKSLAETVTLLDTGLGAAEAETLVWMALARLERAHLLTEPPSFPRPRSRYTRRQVIRTLGLGAAASLLLPLVDSIVSPVAAQAGSCVTAAQCAAMFFLLCRGQPICGSRRDCCQRRGFRCRVRRC
jgi:Coenzyme PQQ synthesis protein D (PqqD)